jgi:hypothetical protein
MNKGIKIMAETFDTQTYVQYGQYAPYYVNGLLITNDATTPNTLLDISIGSCLDSTGTFQLTLSAPVQINSAVNGLNGLDTGSIAASTVYPVYVVWDPVTNLPAGGMISLSYTQPLIPYGYSAFLLIGYVTTDSSKNFLKGFWTNGNTSYRTFTYDTYQPTPITAGHATTYTNVNLITLVPNLNNLPVFVYSSYVGATAGNALNLQAGKATGAQATITCQVATVANTSVNTILAQSVVISTVSSPVINYKETNASDAVAIDVTGYQWRV